MKRKIIFLQYILQQEKNSMLYQVFKAICENPVKNDFVKTCERYLDNLNLKISFEQIGKMSKYKLKKIVKQKTMEAAFKYLIDEQIKQTKIWDIKYQNLEMQEYLLEGNVNTEISKVIFKARGKTLDIKTQKKWKYHDNLCVGCGISVETVDEILTCTGLCEQNDVVKKQITYNLVFGDSTSDMVEVGKALKKKLRLRMKIIEGIT
eukprot:GFUD01059162.1.p1 GENE.GFUD01059162.1~~GFUD01059162.1.p1  ORF type:complete len:206 (-),score=48.58 GFUD01059162.1:20-637(-)